MPQVSRDLLVDLWYPGEIRPEPAEAASADGLLYMFLHRDAARSRTAEISYNIHTKEMTHMKIKLNVAG